MKRSLPTLLAILITTTTYSQVISSFSWNSGSPTQAVTGPNATSIGSSAVIAAYGTSSFGLNPGSPKMDIDLVLPGSYFDVAGIDFSIKFRREESVASFFKRGSLFDFGMNGGNLGANFTVSNGAGGSTSVNAANVAAVPNDHAFHTYRFRYDSNTGVAQMFIDGAVVYTYNGIANRSLYWTSAGNAMIGYQMDAGGTNVAVLDDMLVQNVPANSTLPVTLISFTAQTASNAVALNWTTTREEEMKSYVVERSADGISYAPIATVQSKNNYINTTAYSYTDASPLSPIGYYRLKMVDLDGSYTLSDVKIVNFAYSSASGAISSFPNPATDHVSVRINNESAAQYRYTLVGLNGMVQQTNVVSMARGWQQFTVQLQRNMAPGVYMLQLENISTGSRKAMTVVKQ